MVTSFACYRIGVLARRVNDPSIGFDQAETQAEARSGQGVGQPQQDRKDDQTADSHQPAFPLLSSLAQESFRVTVRLKTIASGVESRLSMQK